MNTSIRVVLYSMEKRLNSNITETTSSYVQYDSIVVK